MEQRAIEHQNKLPQAAAHSSIAQMEPCRNVSLTTPDTADPLELDWDSNFISSYLLLLVEEYYETDVTFIFFIEGD